MIDNFKGKYHFLSNFYPSPVSVELWGEIYQGASSEHVYQAAKAVRPEDRDRILAAATPGETKKLGRGIPLRGDWDLVKVPVMRKIVRAKFLQNEDLRQQLQATGSEELIEGNWWGDRFWGVCRGEGKNYLGRLLMETRAETKQSLAEKLDEATEELGTSSNPHDILTHRHFTDLLLGNVETVKLVIARMAEGKYSWHYFPLLRRLCNYDPTTVERVGAFVVGNTQKMSEAWVDWWENRADPAWWEAKEKADDSPPEQAGAQESAE